MANEVDAYIQSFPEETREILQKIRQTIREVAPGTEETISYGIPTFKLNGKYVVYFAGFKDHVSVYPISAADAARIKGVAPYLSGKGTAKFPLNKPIPYELIEQLAALKMHDRQVE